MLAEVGLGVTSQRLVAGLGRQVPILVIGRRWRGCDGRAWRRWRHVCR